LVKLAQLDQPTGLDAPSLDICFAGLDDILRPSEILRVFGGGGSVVMFYGGFGVLG
jgi:hypothetical protein